MTIKINELSKKKEGSTPVSLANNHYNGNGQPERLMIVDSNEPIEVVDKLKQKGINVKVQKLASGDYIFSDIGIERKTLTDFWGSLTARDKRIWRQVFELKRNFKRPFLVIEKFNFAFLRSPSYSSQIWGSISSIALLGINVVTIAGSTSTSDDFIDFISYCYFSSDPNKKTHAPLPAKSKNFLEVYRDSLCMIPGIGPVTAKKIVSRYKSFEELCSVPQNDLAKLCGRTKTKFLWKLLHGERSLTES